MNMIEKIFNYKIIVFLLLIPYFKPGYISMNFSTLNNIYNIALIIASIIIIVLYTSKTKISKFIMVAIIYELYLFIITLASNGDWYQTIINATSTITLCMLIEYYMKVDCKGLFGIMSLLLGTLITANLITIILFPEGMYITRFYNNYFLGYDNIIITYILPALCVSLFYAYLNKGKADLQFYILFIICLSTVIIRWTATNLVMLFILAIFLIVQRFINTKIFNLLNYLITNIVFTISIVIYKMQYLFSYLIVNILNKDLTFTGRVDIWNRNLEYIKEKPIFGYGIEFEGNRILKNDGFSHAHNQYLEIIYESGVIGLALFGYLIISIIQKLHKYKNHKFTKIISLFICLIFISMQTEVFRNNNFWIIYIIAFNIDIIINSSKCNRGEKNGD